MVARRLGRVLVDLARTLLGAGLGAVALLLASALDGPPSPAAAAGAAGGQISGQAGAAAGAPLPRRPAEPVAVRYELVAELDPVAHRVSGTGRVTWRNRSRLPQRELWLHLYLNAFKSGRTRFLRSTQGEGFRGESLPTSWGYVEVRRLRWREIGRDLWPDAATCSPGDRDDETDIRVPLPRPVAPGDELTLEMAWTAQLPSIVLRSGFAGSFHMVAQWFPKLARLEADGRWAHFPYERLSEFYADFGDYLVTVAVPEGFEVGASGVARGAAERSGGRQRTVFVAEGVHDFAFAAFDRFERMSGSGPDGLAVEVLYPRGDEGAAARDLAVVARALGHYGGRYGGYPYSRLTVIRPPPEAAEAGGMEYPMLITTGGTTRWDSVGVRRAEILATHELAHQWFYGLVASDEHRWPFLDEGLSTYAEVEVLERWYPGASAFALGPLAVGLPAVLRAQAAQVAGRDVVAQPASAFASGSDYVALVYSRAATILLTLGRVYGEERLERALGRYAREQRFAHPDPDALLAAVRSEVGAEAAEQLRLALFETATVDYSAEELRSAPASAPVGIWGSAARRYRGEVSVRRRGKLRFPVEIELVASSGHRVRRSWQGDGTTTTVPYAGDSPLAAAIVDPGQRVLLDDDLSNNILRRSRARIAPRTLARLGAAATLAMGITMP